MRTWLGVGPVRIMRTDHRWFAEFTKFARVLTGLRLLSGWFAPNLHSQMPHLSLAYLFDSCPVSLGQQVSQGIDFLGRTMSLKPLYADVPVYHGAIV